MVKKNPPGLVHAGGKLTKNDKSYYFDVTGHVIANVDNVTNKNRPKVFDKLDYGFNVGIYRKLKRQYNSEKKTLWHKRYFRQPTDYFL
jgi:hypothetical protein